MRPTFATWLWHEQRGNDISVTSFCVYQSNLLANMMLWPWFPFISIQHKSLSFMSWQCVSMRGQPFYGGCPVVPILGSPRGLCYCHTHSLPFLLHLCIFWAFFFALSHALLQAVLSLSVCPCSFIQQRYPRKILQLNESEKEVAQSILLGLWVAYVSPSLMNPLSITLRSTHEVII